MCAYLVSLYKLHIQIETLLMGMLNLLVTSAQNFTRDGTFSVISIMNKAHSNIVLISL